MTIVSSAVFIGVGSLGINTISQCHKGIRSASRFKVLAGLNILLSVLIAISCILLVILMATLGALLSSVDGHGVVIVFAVLVIILLIYVILLVICIKAAVIANRNAGILTRNLEALQQPMICGNNFTDKNGLDYQYKKNDLPPAYDSP